MNGFGFIEYDDEADAKDVVPGSSVTVLPRSPTLRCRMLTFGRGASSLSWVTGFSLSAVDSVERRSGWLTLSILHPQMVPSSWEND